jgi:hypothetical protein
MAKKKVPQSRGVRKRLGRPVLDADTPINMFLTSRDIQQAKQKRRHYAVDEPQNFTECALATCLSKMEGAEVLVMRRYVYVAFPGDKDTLRFQMNAKTREIVHKNDLDQLGSVHANTPVSFLPPTLGRRLNVQGGYRVSKKSRGILTNPPKPAHGDPFQGVYRNGVHSGATVK